jgi:signal transduction histidine kinase
VLQLESITVSRPAEGARERRSFDAALDLLRKSVGEVRRLMSGLHPLVLDESGLVQAIEYLIAEPDAAGGLAIEFEADVQFDRLSALVEGTLFRIVQESLNNIRRHSRARRAKVTLRQRADRLTLIVRDWGVGFDVAQAGVGRHGLDGIRKRAEVLGGTAIILSDPGEGTSIEIDVPLALAAE